MPDPAILEKVRRLKKAFDGGLIKQGHKHEVSPGLPEGSRLNYLYFTLPASVNYQRSSPAMWASALKTYNDPETNYLFYPEKVLGKPLDQLQADLTKHKLALQRNKQVQIWQRIAATLAEHYSSDPREVLREGGMDVVELIDNIRQRHKARFPYLSGAKMSNYWLYILHNFTDAKLANIDKLSIIPDTHIRQCSVVLGLVGEDANPDKVASRWFELLDSSSINPIDMHPVLWNWSRANFQPEV